ncbi:MAG: T9SS type A sorting domain-containing protein [Flavobacterium sp.]|nr:T9SS type A sorting domain-containing protein [Flavobacterium sp.]
MKNIFFLFCFIISLSLKAQENRQTELMAEAEMKSAFKTMNLAVNPNTLNYDITYHKLEFTVDPSIASISGKVTTTFTATANMNTLTFDLFDSMIVSSVNQNGQSLNFTQLGTNELIIDLPTTQLSGTSATVEIVYSGDPTSSGFGSFTVDVHNGTPVLWTLSEPFGARDWWPCKQDLNDKIDAIDVYITAPSQYVSVSNGIEPDAPVIVGPNKITHFRHQYPIPAYLIAIAVTDYQIYDQQAGLGTLASPFYPVTHYIYPETATANIASVQVLPSILNFFESKFGNYAFRGEKYGLCQFGWGGGMEHTTVSFMTAGNNGAYPRSLIAHETGHQWFGDKITCGTWKDIWLNEGITEYLSGLTTEFLDGNTNFRTWKSGKISSVTSIPNTNTSNLYLTDAQATSVNRIFSSSVTYNKGSMVTNMLRYKMGDTMFFQAMNNYINNPMFAYNYAITTEFQGQLEAVYGSSLQEFFNDWVYGQGYPTYTIAVANFGAGQARITVNQTQSSPTVSYFEMPLDIKIIGAGGLTQTIRVDNTSNGQQFLVPVNFVVTGATFDPEKNIIAKSNPIIISTLAIENYNLQQTTALFPNPASDLLNVQMSNENVLENVIIYNLLGQKVIESNSRTIQIENLTNGVYNVFIKTRDGSANKKFIKN